MDAPTSSTQNTTTEVLRLNGDKEEQVDTEIEAWKTKEETRIVAGPLRTRFFREVPGWFLAGRNAWASPLCGPPGLQGGTYGGGVPRLGGAPPCPCGGDKRRRSLAPGAGRGPGRGHGAGRRWGVGGRHLLLQSSDASEGGFGVWAGADFYPRRRLRRRPVHRTSRCDLRRWTKEMKNTLCSRLKEMSAQIVHTYTIFPVPKKRTVQRTSGSHCEDGTPATSWFRERCNLHGQVLGLSNQTNHRYERSSTSDKMAPRDVTTSFYTDQ